MENDISLEGILGYTIKTLVLFYEVLVIVDQEVTFGFSSQRDTNCIEKGKTDILFLYFRFPIFSLICFLFSSTRHLISNNKNVIHKENEFL